jgi:integrase
MPSDPITLTAFAARWPRRHALRPTTRAVYDLWLTQVWGPTLGDRALAAITRRDILAVLDGQRARGLKPGTLRGILGVLRALLTDARDEELIGENPAARLGRYCGRAEPRVEPMNRAELGHFLATAAHVTPEQLPLFLTLARSGLRIGEAQALGPREVDLSARQLAVERTLRRDGTLGAPKTRHSRRRVDMSRQLCLALAPLLERRDRAFLFGTRHGPLRYEQARWAFGRVREAAGLRAGLSLHSLRHSYASMLLAAGVSPAFVQRQLGHASIALTLDLYGRHLPYRDLAAVDGLDDPG